MFSDNFRRGEGKGKGRKGSKAVSKMADLGWKAFQAVNTALPEGKSIQPKWAAEPLLKSYERTAPPLGFPRETDSLCPACVKQVRRMEVGLSARQQKARRRAVSAGVEIGGGVERQQHGYRALPDAGEDRRGDRVQLHQGRHRTRIRRGQPPAPCKDEVGRDRALRVELHSELIEHGAPFDMDGGN